MLKKNKYKKLRYIIASVIAIIFSGIFLFVLGKYINVIGINEIIGIISTVIAVVSAVLIIVELSDSRKLQRAEFVLNLNQAFIENESYASLYTKLESSEQNINIDRIEVSNYLTFFESIYLLLQEKVIDMRVLDDLFAYRFFLAVHNKKVQDIKLVHTPYNFRNIYYLEDIWMKYREKNKLTIYKKEICLRESCKKANKQEIYEEIMNNK